MVALQLQELVLWGRALARVPARTLDLVRAVILGLVLVALTPVALVLEALAPAGLTQEVLVLVALVLAALIPEDLVLEDLTLVALALEDLILGLGDLAVEVPEIQLRPVVVLAIQRPAGVAQTFQEVTYTMQLD